jgi:hypothetical protein
MRQDPFGDALVISREIAFRNALSGIEDAARMGQLDSRHGCVVAL